MASQAGTANGVTYVTQCCLQRLSELSSAINSKFLLSTQTPGGREGGRETGKLQPAHQQLHTRPINCLALSELLQVVGRDGLVGRGQKVVAIFL